MHLSIKQADNSHRERLRLSRDTSGYLIENPVDHHGYSIQSVVNISDSDLDLYIAQLHKALMDAIPDPRQPTDIYQLQGNHRGDTASAHTLSQLRETLLTRRWRLAGHRDS